MLKLNRNYSDYTDLTDSNYPEGKAVNASSSESYDGTPLLAEFMNDVNAAHIAMYKKAYGNATGINGQADTQKASQFADAVAKYTDDKVKAHVDKRGMTDGVHGATSEATAGQIISRDKFGRAKVAAPVADNDIANRKWVLEAVYPVGSLYWSSKDTNPSLLFGGTWVQIKDKFIWAKGDGDTVNDTGGAKTVSLTVANIPAHTHSFKPSGTVSSHSHGIGTIATTSAGTHSHTTNTQSTSTTGIESAHEKFSWTGSHHHGLLTFTGDKRTEISWWYAPNSSSDYIKNEYWAIFGNYTSNKFDLGSSKSDWDKQSSYNNSTGYAWYTGDPLKGSHNSSNPSQEIIKSTSLTASGTCTGDHTHSYSHTHGTDSQGSHTHTMSGSTANSTPTFTGTAGTTGSTGSGTAINNMPPYIVKYCWERTA